MRICYVPGRESSYTRTRVVLNGLKQNNVEVIDCSSKIKKRSLRYLDVFRRFLLSDKGDVVLVGFSGEILIFLVKFFTRKPIIFDAYLSVYDSLVFDKKIVKEGSLKSEILFFLDKYSCKLADKVLLDTNEHMKYFNRTFGTDMNKISRVVLSADDGIFKPRTNKNEEFTVEFHGEFIPLQGVDHIVKAAKLLENYEDIRFVIVGKGQTFDKCKKLAEELKLKNLSFEGWKSPDKIPEYVAKADIGLGIFGDTEKTKRVIPNKAYEIIAMKKPLISGNTPAMREFFENGKNAMLCKIKDPKEIADSILRLKRDKILRDKIANNGYKLFIEKFRPKVIGLQIKEIAESLIKNE
jgi:glycosyltransferase involved in cell wall biosynthesis